LIILEAADTNRKTEVLRATETDSTEESRPHLDVVVYALGIVATWADQYGILILFGQDVEGYAALEPDAGGQLESGRRPQFRVDVPGALAVSETVGRDTFV